MYQIRPEKTITGTITCENCGIEIKWFYNVHPKEYGIYSFTRPIDTILASRIKNDNNNDTYYVRCISCDKVNYFQYVEK